MHPTHSYLFATRSSPLARATLLVSLALLATLFSGCAGTNYRAEEVSRTMSYPLIFTDTIEANGVKKETQPDGKVVRKAENLVHTTTIFGFTRTSKYKGAELEIEPEKK